MPRQTTEPYHDFSGGPEITFLPSPTSETQKAVFERAARGARAQGIKCSIEAEPKSKAVGVWGWRNGEKWHKMGHDVLVFERGYLGDRYEWTSIAWNGLNGRGDFCLTGNETFERFAKNHEPLKPWRDDGDKIIIMGQVPGDMSLQGKDLTQFYEMVANLWGQAYKMPVMFKPHPVGVERGKNFQPKLPIFYGNMDEALNEAFIVHTFNSNSAVDAVVAGIPAVSCDQGSMAWDVTSHFVYDRLKPEREQWAARLAHCQWSPDEIERGEFWGRMRCKLEN